ncbi:hypothetical protein NQ318_012077 [Aromia moschata]|uniref:Acyltransferase C-terminal domain-containing protein n=1 Tax=Aromia moschata TaxID=1265417 RepID=A0AAV8X353_9CUCU|nr:hypothetical protein NQ318_012077 [Aromia moschata]
MNTCLFVFLAKPGQLVKPDKLEYVLDITIAYPDGWPVDLSHIVFGHREPCQTVIFYRRYLCSDVPQEPEALTKWLIQRWEEKEKMLEHFYKTGEFSSEFRRNEMCPPQGRRPGLPQVPDPPRLFYRFDLHTHTDVHGRLQLLQLSSLLALCDRIFGLSALIPYSILNQHRVPGTLSKDFSTQHSALLPHSLEQIKSLTVEISNGNGGGSHVPLNVWDKESRIIVKLYYAYLRKSEPPTVSAGLLQVPFSPALLARLHLFLGELDVVRVFRELGVLLHIMDILSFVVADVAHLGELLYLVSAPLHATKETILVAVLFLVPGFPYNR